MDNDSPDDSTIDEACWEALDLAASIQDPVQRLVALQDTSDEVASAQRRLESAKVAALAEALLNLSVERLTLQLDGNDDIVAMVERPEAGRLHIDGPTGPGFEVG